jgi:outer membrane receptor protein involved in Fe transport
MPQSPMFALTMPACVARRSGFSSWFLLAAVAIWLLPAGPACAQVDTAALGGTVRDASGAVVPKATVTVTDTQTNVRTVIETDASGDYNSPPLKVGAYNVSAEAAGFKSETRTHVTLQVQDRLRLDFVMQVGPVSENVTVEAAVSVIQTETSSLGQVVNSRQMADLPLNGRNYLDLATLTSGVVRTEGTNGNAGGSFVANGTRGNLNNYLLDGVDNNSNDSGQAVLRTNVDAIEEFKVQTNAFSAEFGRSGGAVINAVIKSGTNQLHGSVFEFLRNSSLDARDFFEDPTQKKASFKQNQFGGTLGGPIKRDKLFFFGDYQGTRIRTPMSYVSSVPTLAQRAGDFSGEGNNIIYDPATYDAATNTRQPFAGNRIPADRIASISQNYMNLYPEPNQPDKLRNNYVISPVDADRIDQWDGRTDYSVSSVDQVFGRFSWSDRQNFQPAPLPGLANGGNSSTGDTFERTEGLSLGGTHTFSPRIVNELRAGFNHVRIRRGLPVGGTQLPAEGLRVPGVVDNPSTNGLTIFAPSGYRRLGDPGFAPTLLASREMQLSDTVSIIRGRHSIRLGGQLRWSEFNIFQVSRPRGNFNFSGQFTQDPAASDATGSSLADMLLGVPSFSNISSLMDLGNRQHVFGAFVQDDFKLTPSLTLNLGLRYDYTSPIDEVHDKQANFDFATQQLVAAGKNGASRGLTTVDKLNFSPRVGLAWAPFADRKTVFRSGYGVFYSGQEIRTAAPLQLAYNEPFFYEPQFISNGLTPALTVAQGFPPLDPSQAVNPPVTSEDWRLRTPYYQHWNFSIERQMPSQIGLEFAYAGSKGTHLQVATDHNQVAVPGPADVQVSRPYPNYGAFTSIENRGNSTYHSLQFKAEKRLSHGLSLLSAFTWAKSINDLPEICCAGPFPQNSYDLRSEKGRSDFDERLRWVTSFDYELPLGKGRRFLSASRTADLVIGGWHVGGILAFGSGFPFSPIISYDPSNTGSQGLARANRTSDGNLSPGRRSPDQWFDANAFQTPDAYTFGNSGRNVLDGPGSQVANLALRKMFAVSERTRVEFRAEFFNAFNHPNFAQPDNYIDDGPGAAGVITSLATPMRQVQFGLRVAF